MCSKYDLALVISSLAVGIFGVGYAFGQRKKLNDITDKLDKSVEDLAANIEIQPSDALIRRAIDRAVERETSYAVRNAVDSVSRAVKSDISAQVKTAINSTYSDIRKSVVDETAKKVADIDMKVLKSEVIEKAKEAAAEKLDDSLDDILEEFRRNLGRVSQIYQSIAQAFPNGKELKLSLG